MNAKHIRCAVIGTLILLLVGCGPAAATTPPPAASTRAAGTPATEVLATQTSPPPTATPTAAPTGTSSAGTTSMAALGDASNRFGFELLQTLHASGPGTNLSISPPSLSLLLQMVYNGAEGDTAQEIANVLHVDGVDIATLNQASEEWQAQLTATPAVELLLGNSLWVQQDYHLLDAFVESMANTFHAQATTLDFADPAAAEQINTWVAEATEGKIDHLFDTLDPNVITYLLNTVYFKGAWSKPFDPANTRPMPFYLADGSTVSVPVMTQQGDFAYTTGDGYSALALPYGELDSADGDSGTDADKQETGRGVRMVIVLPDEDVSLDDLLAQMTPEMWQTLLGNLSGETTVMVSLPRFKVEYDATLNDALAELGMARAFTDPDFANMIEGGGAWISYVRHKTVVEVNEEGTTAAAVSVGAMELSMPPSFTVNRPFFYAIHDDATNTILFMGAVYVPEALGE